MTPTPEGGRFAGFPDDATTFYERLAVDNTRDFWAANRDQYEASVKAPVLALTAELEAEFGPFNVFRPHRDVRFSKDKSPYKTHQGAVTEGEGGEFYYLHLDAEGLYVASGYYRMAADQLDRFRRAVDDDVTGADLVERVAALDRRFGIEGRALSTAPRGYSREHPRVRFLQHKGLMATRAFGTPAWLGTRQTVRRVAETWRAATPVNEWLNRHVGPSRLEPDARR